MQFKDLKIGDEFRLKFYSRPALWRKVSEHHRVSLHLIRKGYLSKKTIWTDRLEHVEVINGKTKA